ncbi:MAG TPA: twin-arginine translocase subunit TatB [Gammaproteobacteria bacterium]|nr:twin-arginine translocase subunit TatB [Gammaproteobacteria bacterium]
MFDIGFMELALIGVVALVVIGPERLPGVARTVGRWMGSAKRFVHSVQADINQEVSKAEELKRLLEEQTKIQSVHEILEQTPVEENERKPVPRAVPATKPHAESEPEYELKAISDTPDTPLDEAASGTPAEADVKDVSSHKQ